MRAIFEGMLSPVLRREPFGLETCKVRAGASLMPAVTSRAATRQTLNSFDMSVLWDRKSRNSLWSLEKEPEGPTLFSFPRVLNERASSFAFEAFAPPGCLIPLKSRATVNGGDVQVKRVRRVGMRTEPVVIGRLVVGVDGVACAALVHRWLASSSLAEAHETAVAVGLGSGRARNAAGRILETKEIEDGQCQRATAQPL